MKIRIHDLGSDIFAVIDTCDPDDMAALIETDKSGADMAARFGDVITIGQRIFEPILEGENQA